MQESKLVDDDADKASNQNKPVERNSKKVQVKTFVSLYSKLRLPGEETDLVLIRFFFLFL